MPRETDLEALRRASEGLVWMSETDAGFEVITWENRGGQERLTPEQLLALVGRAPDTPVEVVGLDHFFRNRASEHEWQDDYQRQQVQRFQQLVQVLREDLSDIQVFRVGETEIDVYLVGRTSSGAWAGLKTFVVET